MRTLSCRLFVACLMGLAVPALRAQEGPLAQLGASIDVRVINLEVVATNREGERVRGLGRGDFRLIVDGREVPIEYFAEVDSGAIAGADAETADAVPRKAAARSYLVFVDDAFTIGPFRNAVLRGIEAQLAALGAADQMAIVAFDGRRVDVLCPWSADREALARGLSRARDRKSLGLLRLAQSRAADSDEDLVSSVRGPGGGAAQSGSQLLTPRSERITEVELEDRAMGARIESPVEPFGGGVGPEAAAQMNHTAAAIAATLRAFATPEGRRVLVLVSGDWAIASLRGSLEQVTTEASQFGYTIYPIDASVHSVAQVIDADEWAGRTGGRAILSGFRTSAFEQIAEDSATYYSLGFSPAWKGNDRWHSIGVEAAVPGVKTRVRDSVSEASGRTEAQQAAETVVLVGGRPEDQRLRIELGKPRSAPDRRLEVTASIEVPLDALVFAGTAGPRAAEAYVSAAVEDETGDQVLSPGYRGRVEADAPHKTDGFATIRIRLTLRKTRQRVVFVASGTPRGPYLWGEARFVP